MSKKLRCALLVLAVLSALGFFALAEKAEDQGENHQWFGADLTAKSLVQSHRHPSLERPMRLLSHLGGGLVLIPLNVAVLLLLLPRHKPLALFIPAVTGGAVVLEWLTKWLVARPRPRLTGYGFPSGHVLASVVFYGALIYLLYTLVKHRPWRWVGASACALVIIAVAYTRMYLNAHWLTDVVGALTGGTAYLLITLISMDTWLRPGPAAASRSGCESGESQLASTSRQS